jgi:ABC-type branched-subunit amino acid transport system substrate-binding protein
MQFVESQRNRITRLSAVLTALFAVAANAQTAPGVTATEIKLGQTNPYSGPMSSIGHNGQGDAAYIKMLNDAGGINGRQIALISYDDAYSPPRTVEQTRKLVEQDQVAFIYRSLGTAPNTAIAKYLNDRKVPQLFIGSGSAKFFNPDVYPWTMSYVPSYVDEGIIYGHYLLREKPDATVAVLYQNDDLGKDFLAGLKKGLRDQASKVIVKEAAYEVTDPTVDSQIISLQASGASFLFIFTTSPRATSQAIRKAYEVGWKPTYVLTSVGNLLPYMKPAGLEKQVGALTAAYIKDPSDPQWKDDPGIREWNAWMDKYLSDADKEDTSYLQAYMAGTLLRHILTGSGNDLSRENIMKQATHMKDVPVSLLLPGILVNTTPTDYHPVKQMQLRRFDGVRWVSFGGLITN